MGEYCFLVLLLEVSLASLFEENKKIIEVGNGGIVVYIVGEGWWNNEMVMKKGIVDDHQQKKHEISTLLSNLKLLFLFQDRAL